MQRIALISEHASPLAEAGSVDSGGQNIYVANLAQQLARSGYRVDVFTRRDRPMLPAVLRWKPNIRVIHVPAGPARFVPKEQLLPLMPAFADFLLDHFRRETVRYDVVHAHFFMSGLAAQDAAAAIDAPLVMSFHALGEVRRLHQGRDDGFPPERAAIERALVQRAERIVAACPQDAADLRRHYDADPRKLELVPCGFDPGELRCLAQGEARSALDWDPQSFSILQLGRMVPRKGIANVVRALALLRGRGLDARLYVAGGNSPQPNSSATPEIGRLQALAASLGIDQRVHFIGRRGRAELSLCYGAADVFVTTPWYEPFGITPVEAMACGLPVVGSAVGGIRSTVEHGRTGYLVPPEDPPALAQRLERLCLDAPLRRRMGRAGRARVHGLYTWQSVAAQLVAVYRRALGHDLPEPRRAGSALYETTGVAI